MGTQLTKMVTDQLTAAKWSRKRRGKPRQESPNVTSQRSSAQFKTVQAYRRLSVASFR